MDIQGKKLLILAGAGVHCKVVRAAKEMGVYTIVTDYLEVEHSPAKQIADEYWMLNITDVEGIVQKCREEHVDGVMNFCIDPAQIPYQRICEQLHLPCIGTADQFATLTDKRKFKDYCIAHDVDVIPEYTEAEIRNGKAEYPLFVKPTNSRGSRGQSVCRNREEALNGIAVATRESKDGGYICEKNLEGCRDIASAFFVVDGEPYLVKFGDRYLGRKEDNLQKQVMCTVLPSSFSPVFKEKVEERVKGMIRSLGIKFGPVFLQGFVDGDTIRYYDPALRMPGGDYDVILEKVTGFSTVKSFIHFALTGDTKTAFGNPENAYELAGGTAFLVTVSCRAGKMARVVGLDKMLEREDVVYGRQIIPEGSVITATGDIAQRVAGIGAYLTSRRIGERFLQELYQTYRVFDEAGQDMVVSKVLKLED